MGASEIVRRLKSISHYRIVFTKHAKYKLYWRDIEKKVVLRDLHNPQSLSAGERLHGGNEEKYKLWFISRKGIAYIYIVAINNVQEKIIVVTLMTDNMEGK